ncbi:hypothetical protein [uncultured Ferrimonas sp.]|uniref:hypothetical protein n=1 Tax=uncultured Ferrimonas sp. TaxID=432640 RepID=UPI00261AEA28|nr:hypothetical protein [uncultured Ferrimonas sp.]
MSAINISLDHQLLAKLIGDGHLCVAQLNALDQHSKAALWRLCLECSCDMRFDSNGEPLQFKPYTDRRLSTDSNQ